MRPSRRTAAAAAAWNATGVVAASVIAARALAFATGTRPWTAWQHAEFRRMSSEKAEALAQGLQAAGIEAAMLPARWMQLGMRPSAWTPVGWMQAWIDASELWLGVGHAALQPASTTARRNRARLARRAQR